MNRLYPLPGPTWNWSNKQPLVVSKIASARVNFIKSSHDDNFKALGCPAATDACRKNSYLVDGDLVLTGTIKGEFTCVSYQSPTAKQRGWSRGWMPTTALAPVAPMPAPKEADIDADVIPGKDAIALAGDGSKPLENADADSCRACNASANG